MIRRRLYNPAQLTPDELKASFVARGETLEEMLRLLREQTPSRPCQHMMLIGPRGMGKTTLGLRFLHAVEETPELAAIWQPVPFHEESYEIGDLADFWLTALRHLSRATDNPEWADRADALARDERDPERLAAYALAALVDHCQASGRRLILFVENLDGILHQLRNKREANQRKANQREAHALRASLIERPEILLLGSANAVFDAIRSHAQPFYEFFRLVTLEGIGPEETARLLETLAGREGRPDVPQALNLDHGRLETLRRLTGGNPRLLVLACRMLVESPLGSAFEDLEQLIDEQTPYFKARIEELPIQARKVFHCLADGWTPLLAKEVAGAAKLSSSHASAQLKQLVERGYAQEVRLPGTKRPRYEVGDRFYNIYYLLRFSRTNRQRLERLVASLHDLFGASGMRPMYPTFLEALRLSGPRTGDSSDWLEIMARYVAADPDFESREDWRRGALDLAKELIGPNAPVAEKIENAFVTQHPPEPPLLGKLLQRGDDHFQANQFTEAEEVFREILAVRPDNLHARWKLGMSLFLGGKNEDAVVALEHCMQHVDSGGSPASRTLIVLGLTGRSIAYSRLRRLECAAEGLEKISEYVDPEASAELRALAASTYSLYGLGLADSGRLEESIAALLRVTEYVRPDDSIEIRPVAASVLLAKGNILSELERQAEAIGAWDQVIGYVRTEDPIGLRDIAVYALANKFRAIFPVEIDGDATPNSYEGSIAAVELMAEYVQPDDATKLRDMVAGLLSRMGMLLNLFGDFGRAEAVSRKATDIDPSHVESWRVLAEAILQQGDDARLSEAEDYARRAVDLTPENPIACRTLSEVLACLGKWTEALNWLERSLLVSDEELPESKTLGLIAPLIRAVAAGHGKRVKKMMEEAGLAEPLEPLWHAVRAELGEELEPLPAEIMDAVTEIRNRFSKE